MNFIHLQFRTAPRLLAISSLLWLAAHSSALTLKEAVTTALRQNPDLQAAQVMVARAQAGADWAGRLDNPELEIGFTDDSFGEDEGEGSVELSFRQSFPITSRLGREKELKASSLALAKAEILDHQRKLIFEVERAMIESAKTKRLLKKQTDLLKSSEEMVRYLETQVQRGEASQLDLNQSQLTSQSLGQQLRSIQSSLLQQNLNLRLLLGESPEAYMTVDYSLKLPETISERRPRDEEVLGQRPDYQWAQAHIEYTDLNRDLEHARRWEDIAVEISGEWEESVDAPEGLEKNTLVGISLSLPLPLWQQNREAMRQAEADRQGATKNSDRLRLRIHHEVAAALQARTDAHELAEIASGPLVQLAEQNYADQHNAYQQGFSTLLQVQLAQQQLIEFRTRELEAIASFYAADAQLRFVTGETLKQFTTTDNPE